MSSPRSHRDSVASPQTDAHGRYRRHREPSARTSRRSRSRSHSPPQRSGRSSRDDHHRRRSRSRERSRSHDRNHRDRSRDRSRERMRSRRSRSRSFSRSHRGTSDSRNGSASTAANNAHDDKRASDSASAAVAAIASEPVVAVNPLAHLTEEEQMQALMGFGDFDSTKGKPIDDNNQGAATGAVRKENKRAYRQYMNRRGGFNRLLEKGK